MVSVNLGNSGNTPPRKQSQSDDFLFMPWTVLYDDRERAGGWRFTGLVGDSRDKYRPIVVPQRETHLKTADYTIDGCPVFIERKSQEDFLSTISHGHERFRDEHARMFEIMRSGGKCFVIVESDYGKIMDELRAGMGRVHPNAVAGAVSSLSVEFGVPWLFGGSRRGAEELAFRVLRDAWDHFNESVLI